MTDEARVQECNRRIVEGWRSRLPDGDWTVSYLFWGPAGDVVYSATTALDRSGRTHVLTQPAEVHQSVGELRAAMSDGQRGAWISAEFKLTDDGVLEAAYNWDRRFYWGTHPGNPWAPDPDPQALPEPSDAQFAAELRRYPRERMFLPAWYPAGDAAGAAAPAPDSGQPTATGPAATSEALARARAVRVSLPDEVKPLQDAWGWPGVLAAADDAVLGNLDASDAQRVAALEGRLGDDAHDLALDALVDDAVASTMLVLDRSPGLAAVRLLREWLAVRDERAPADLAAADLGEPLSALVARDDVVGRAARGVRARLESVIRLVVEDDVDERFAG